MPISATVTPTTFGDYFELPAEIRKERERALRSISRTARRNPDKSSDACLNYEAQHPPLYYLLCAGIYRFFADQDLPTLAFILRVFSMLLGSLTVIAAYHTAKLFFSDPIRILCLPLMVALLPMFISTVARISNDSLGVPLFSLLIVLVLRYLRSGDIRRYGIYIETVTGLGLLTKAYFLTTLPVIALVIIAGGGKAKSGRRVVCGMTCAFLQVVLIAGWWYARNYIQYGTVSGLFAMASAVPASLKDQVTHVFETPWLAALNIVFREHLWTGNSSFITLSKMIYRSGYVLAGLAIIGLLKTYMPVPSSPENSHAGRSAVQKSAVSAMILFYAFFLLGMMYQVQQTHLITGQITIGGWYLYAVVVPAVLLL